MIFEVFIVGELLIVLYLTTCETKIGFLLIEVSRQQFNQQNLGHQGSILGGRFSFIRVTKKHTNQTYPVIQIQGHDFMKIFRFDSDL